MGGESKGGSDVMFVHVEARGATGPVELTTVKVSQADWVPSRGKPASRSCNVPMEVKKLHNKYRRRERDFLGRTLSFDENTLSSVEREVEWGTGRKKKN